MPTPSDYSDFRFSSQQDDYKQTAMEQKDRLPDLPPLPDPAQGNYPRIFDQGYGPAETPSGGVYPDVYSRVKVSGSNPGSGEFGQCVGQSYGPYPGSNMVPDAVPSKQFSSDKTGDPKELLRQTRAEVAKHSDQVNSFGLNMPVATMGSHPWLRDGLADMSEMEPGNAEPSPGLKYPGGGKS